MPEFLPFLAQQFDLTTPMVVVGIVAVLILGTVIWASRYVKVPPNQALIVSGRGVSVSPGVKSGFRIVRGGATFIWPVLERVDRLSLEIMTIDVKTPAV